MKKNIKLYLILLSTLFLNSQTIAQISGKLIGEQIWTTSNLNVSKFQNGDPIYEAKTKAQWNKASEDKKPAWCYYQNNAQNGVIYGKLYNWYAVNDSRGLAPKGWHIPTSNEWYELISFLEKDGKNVNEALKTKTGWKQYESGGNEVGSDCGYCNGTGQRYSSISYKYITCAICGGTGGDRRYVKKRTLSGNGTNTSGFSAKPGANRFAGEDDDYDFNKNIGFVATWWLPSEAKSEDNAEYIYINNDDYTPTIDNYSKGYGSSIRLIKDNPEKIERDRVAYKEIMEKERIAIIGLPVVLGNLLVAQFDFPKLMSWDDAKKACESLGDGWRLPTIDELKIVYQNKDKLGSFQYNYWSSSEVESDSQQVRTRNFKVDNSSYFSKSQINSVRAVKGIK